VLEKLLQLLRIRCNHSKTSQPFTAASPRSVSASGDWEKPGAAVSHYVVCLECGRKFNYDWQKMRIVS
jgi:hypothetical protein